MNQLSVSNLVNENSSFFIEPRSGFRRSYNQFALDVGIPTASAWFDALAGSNAAEQLAGQDVACVGAADRDDSDADLLDALDCYRVFVGIVAALVAGREWELNAETGGRSSGADELLVKRPSPLVPRDPPRGRVEESTGNQSEEVVAQELGEVQSRSEVVGKSRPSPLVPRDPPEGRVEESTGKQSEEVVAQELGEVQSRSEVVGKSRPSPLVPRDPPKGRVDVKAGTPSLRGKGEVPSSGRRNDRGDASVGERGIGGDDLANLILESSAKLGIRTSGTTGRPKLIWHSMQSLARAVKTGERHKNDVWGFAYEQTHFAGVQVFLQALANRNPIVWLFDLSPEEARVAILENGVTHLSATPTFFKMLCGGCEPTRGVQSVTLGGEAFDAAAFAEVYRAFPNARIRNIYASTELGSLLQADGDVFSVPNRLRHAIKVDGGELHVAGELLAESINSGDTSYFSTGDQVEVVSDEPLSFRFVGRRSDWINVGGTKVNPLKVEAAVAELTGVMAVRVYGQPNSVIGNLVACEIVLGEDVTLTENDLKRQLSDRLTRYEMPQLVRFVTELTMTRTGKKQR